MSYETKSPISESRSGSSGLLATNRTLGQTTGIAVLGALWAAVVAYHLGFTPIGGATSAPPLIQVEGLRLVFYVNAGFLFIGLMLAIWGLLEERREGKENSLVSG